jgi:hypothetical protein
MWEAYHPASLAERAAQRPYRCRCGSPVPQGSRCLQFTDVPEGLREALACRAFCSPGCVRAELLEQIESAEGTKSVSFLDSIRQTYSALLVVFTLSPDQGGGGSGLRGAR